MGEPTVPPSPYWVSDEKDVTLYLGDCLTVLAAMEADSVDAVVTDPPAAVSFMNKSWDSDRGGRDKWVSWLADRMEAAARVLKPGGHLLVWSLPRTSHWTAWALEDAGLEIRDCVLHLFGSGYPKSHDVSKAIDKEARGGMVRAKLLHFAEARGISGRWLEERGIASAASFTDWTVGGHVPSDRNWQIVKVALEVSDEEEAAYERGVIGRGRAKGTRSTIGPVGVSADDYDITAPATEDAARWSGFGTALKPGQEMWWLARKPVKGTVAANVLESGTGALNIAACRVGAPEDKRAAGTKTYAASRLAGGTDGAGVLQEAPHDGLGRWPANIVFTHSASCEMTGTRLVRGDSRSGQPRGQRPGGFGDIGADSGDETPNGTLHGDQEIETWACDESCPVAELDRQSGGTRAAKPSKSGSAGNASGNGVYASGAGLPRDYECISRDDSGSASRFYPTFRYQAKAPASERPRLEDGTAHETVKSLGLISWLVKLITPPGGTVLDLFAGSGPVGEAAIIEGFRCILIEQDPKSAELIKTRLSKPIQPVLFGDLGEAS